MPYLLGELRGCAPLVRGGGEGLLGDVLKLALQLLDARPGTGRKMFLSFLLFFGQLGLAWPLRWLSWPGRAPPPWRMARCARQRSASGCRPRRGA